MIKSAAIEKGYLKPEDEIDPEKAFLLVRDMPYARASSRDPETTIKEWRGTCSGKHYLLKELFRELGYSSRMIACTSVSLLDPKKYWGKMRKLLKESGGKFVDVHNYLILKLPDGEMIVDATWPIYAVGMETVINKDFVLGVNQKIAVEPIESWVVPDDRVAQEFKDELLNDSFSPEELAHREELVETVSKMANNKLIKFLVWLEKRIKGEVKR